MLEHAVSDFMVDRMDEVLGHPTRDPHGDPIPSVSGSVDHPAGAVLLSSCQPGSAVVVERVLDRDPDLLQFLTRSGIGVGTRLEVRAGAAWSDAVEIVIPDGTTVPLGRRATDSIWVTAV